MTILIAICGPAGAGKTTVADYLVKKHGAARYSFAKPLKEMVKNALDFTPEQVYGTQEQKEATDPRYGHSPRWFLQRIGTDGCRNTFGADFWTRQCLNIIAREQPRLAVIDDLRFADEATAVLGDHRVDGFVWRLHPVNTPETARALNAEHASEREWYDLDASLDLQPISRGVDELYALVDKAFDYMPMPALGGGMRW